MGGCGQALLNSSASLVQTSKKTKGCEFYLRPPSSCHGLQLVLLLEPTDRTQEPEEPFDLIDAPVIFRADWDRRDVQVAVNVAERAILQKELNVDGHSYLGNCQGGTCILLTIAGSLVAEKLTWFLTSIETLRQTLVMRQTVRAMSASTSLGAANVFGDHTVETRIIVGGEGEHLSTDGALWKFNLVHCLANRIKEFRSISLAVEDSIVKVATDVIFPRKNQLLALWDKADTIAADLVQAYVHVNFVVEERPRVLLHTPNYAGKSSFAKSELNYIPHSLTLVTPNSTSSPCTQLFLIYNTY